LQAPQKHASFWPWNSCEDSAMKSLSSGESLVAPRDAQGLTDAVVAQLKPKGAPLGSLVAPADRIGELEWIPNSTACEICEKHFTWFTRPHHCRACGSCVCKTCSPVGFQLDHPLGRRHISSGSETFIGDSFCETYVPSVSTSRAHRVCSVCHLGSRLRWRLTLASFEAPATEESL